MTETSKSEVEIAESSVNGRIEMAAAEITFDVVSLLNKAVRASGRSQKEIAESLGVGESRVSQVLTGDGNLRVTTLARYLRAAGYALRLEALSADPDVIEIPKPRSRRQRAAEARQARDADLVKCWESPVLSTAGVGSAYTFHASPGTGHTVLMGERRSVSFNKLPPALTTWVIEKTLPEISWSEDQLTEIPWSKPVIAGTCAVHNRVEAISAAAVEELDRNYAHP